MITRSNSAHAFSLRVCVSRMGSILMVFIGKRVGVNGLQITEHLLEQLRCYRLLVGGKSTVYGANRGPVLSSEHDTRKRLVSCILYIDT